MQHSQRALGAAFLAGLLLLGGCAAYSKHYRFTPELVETEAAVPGEDDALVRVLASVRGVRPANPEKQIGRSVEVRVRVENRADAPATLSAAGLELVSGDLQSFARPHVEPEGESRIPPGGSMLLTAWFPLPENGPDDVDLRSLILNWTVHVGGEALSRSATFSGRYEREPRYSGRYYYPYHGYPYGHRSRYGHGLHGLYGHGLHGHGHFGHRVHPHPFHRRPHFGHHHGGHHGFYR